MSKLTHTLQAAVVIAAVAAPGTAEARLNRDPGSQATRSPVTHFAAPAARPRLEATAHGSAAAFDWGDAALGAGATLLVVGAAGVGTVTLRTRRRARPQVSAG